MHLPFPSPLTRHLQPSSQPIMQLGSFVTVIMGYLAAFQTCRYTFPLFMAIFNLFRRLFRSVSKYYYFEIPEAAFGNYGTNSLYQAVHLYLSNTPSVAAATRQTITRTHDDSAFTFSTSDNQTIYDTFRGTKAIWEHAKPVAAAAGETTTSKPQAKGGNKEKRSFTLRIKEEDRSLILHAYLDHIMERAADIRRRNQNRCLYSNSCMGFRDMWLSVPFKHPSTFETLAMDPKKKEEIMADLSSFVDGGSFYQKTGRAWKRGYLLYGPPGTGKSSMIAAMANYLGYDIYDLELTHVRANSELRTLLTKTTSKSIIVIEDIDCSYDLKKRQSNIQRKGALSEDQGTQRITLSGLLNFTDGLWSCCGSERIFVFTTNHIENIDPALLRSGRMDMHIHLSYCSFPALKILMKTYLGFEDDQSGCYCDGLLTELEYIIDEAEITPADISELLIKNRRREKQAALEELLEVLRGRVEQKRAREDSVVAKEEDALDNPMKDEGEDIPTTQAMGFGHPSGCGMGFRHPSGYYAGDAVRLGEAPPILMGGMYPFP